MSAEYRRKIVNWLTSMLVVLLTAVVIATHRWFTVSIPFTPVDSDDLGFLVGPPAAASAVYIILFPLLWLWHMADFIQQRDPQVRWLQLLGSYQWLLVVISLHGAAQLLAVSTWLNDLTCNVPEPTANFGFWDGCGSFTPWWKEIILIVLTLAFFLLVLSKLIMAIASRATALRKSALFNSDPSDRLTP